MDFQSQNEFDSSVGWKGDTLLNAHFLTYIEIKFLLYMIY